MVDDAAAEVPEGAAVLPELPPDLNVHPLLLAVLHAAVFIAGSSEEVVEPAAGREALEHLSGYLQRLTGPDLERVRADLECLVTFSRQQHWHKHEVQFFKNFLNDMGVEGEA